MHRAWKDNAKRPRERSNYRPQHEIIARSDGGRHFTRVDDRHHRYPDTAAHGVAAQDITRKVHICRCVARVVSIRDGCTYRHVGGVLPALLRHALLYTPVYVYMYPALGILTTQGGPTCSN